MKSALDHPSRQYSGKDHESRLKAIFETAIDGIITIDERGIIESINPAAAQLFGYPSSEVIGRNISMLMPSPHRESHDGYMHRYQKTGEARIIGIGREVTGLKKDGSTFPFRLAISEVKLEEGSIYTGFIHDLTVQKEAEEKLRRYAAELERSNRELEDFAYISSHDLQEPLRKIQAFGSRVQSREGHKLSENGQDYLNRMMNAAERLQKLINDLLNYSRVSTKTQPFQQLDLNAILNEVINDFEFVLEQGNGKVEVEDLPSVEGDPLQIRLLFQNLVGNALKFQREGVPPEINVYAQPVVGDLGEQAFVDFFVEDNGIGFREKYLDRVFQIFQRLEGQKYKGSGVGLAICKKIVSRHGGDISAKSRPGEGATFRVRLPLRQGT